MNKIDVKTASELRDPSFLMDYPDSTEEIPILDIAPYLAGEPGALEKVAQRLGEITATIGFFYLKGHGVPKSLISRVFEASHQVHALSTEEKAKLPYRDYDSFRTGYTSADNSRQNANSALLKDTKPNLLSKFSTLREVAGGPPSHNVWPESLPGFRETLLQYQAAIEKLGRQFLPLWASSLAMPLDFFDRFFDEPQLTLNLLHYAPQKEIGNRQYGISPHVDSAFMTFLAQSNVGGLAVQMPSGHWRLVDIVPDTLLVNTGNTMVRWTNDRYLSTKHRVINTNDVDRYSIPVFFGPSKDALIETVPTCITADRPRKYDPVRFVDMRKSHYAYRE